MLGAYIISCIFIAWIFLFYNMPASIWLASATILVILGYTLNLYSLLVTISLFFIIATTYSLLCIKFIRRNIITNKSISFFKQKLPKISVTESQAIEAGDVWWEGDIFSANLNWNKIKKYNLSELTSNEQSFLNNEAETLCDLLQDWDIVFKSKDLSEDAWEYIRENKFFALNIPKEFGGMGFSATAQSSIVAKIASKSIAAAVTIMVPNSLGPGELLAHYGTEKQKKEYLPKLADGSEIPCFALTSQYAGSDAGGMLDNGVICNHDYNGEQTLGIKLNFSKRYITLAPVATVMGLAFKLYDPEKLLDGKESLGVTLALIPTNHSGISIGRRHFAMFSPFQNGPISGKDVFIPLDFIIGGKDYIGKGWFMLMECLSSGRGISLPALATATTQASFLASSTYSGLRRQFKTPIAHLEGIQEHLAKVAGLNYINNAMRVVTASAIDNGLKPAVISGIAKYHMTENARTCINSAMDIQGGKAVMNGPNNSLAGMYTAVPISITVEGANILTRSLIIFGQGAFRAHPYVLDELTALNEQDKVKSLYKFDNVLFKHIKFVFSNIVRSITYNLQKIYQPIVEKIKPNNKLRLYKKDLTRLSTSLALTTDLALLYYGGNLKTKERQSARLGDVVSNIYMALCVIKHHEHLSAQTSIDSKKHNLYINWSLNYLVYNAEMALLGFINNFPLKSLSILMRIIALPFGANNTRFTDKLDSKLAMSCMNPDDIFFKLTDLCYKNEGPLVDLLNTFLDQDKLKPTLLKVEQLIKSKKILFSNDIKVSVEDAFNKGLLEQQEYNSLMKFALSLDKIINVDDFEKLRSEIFNNMQDMELSI